VRKALAGSLLGIALTLACGAAMLPFRAHLSIATVALVFVLPVLAGALVGGFAAGGVSVAAGFVVYDLGFVPPYGRLRVATAQDWVALGLYVVVMLLVSKVVADLRTARAEAQDRSADARRLFDLSELLVEERTREELLRTIVQTVMTAFAVGGVTLLVPSGERLEIAASAGERLEREELQALEPLSGIPVSVGSAPGTPDTLHTVALTASGRPVGMLALRGLPASETDRALLRTFANHAALALERERLREQALRSELLEEVDRLRHAMVGAVSHDLRSPLATMKVASTTLLDQSTALGERDRHLLHQLIDVETDRLTRLVSSLLDMTRIDAGVLEVHRRPTRVRELVAETVSSLHTMLEDRPVEVVVPDAVPEAEIDRLLIGQVLANLLDNADRHAPAASLITVAAEDRGDRIALSVTDRGEGVPSGERESVFDRFVRFDTGGRAGLGLTIAKTFVEAHGERIWVEDVEGGGARFVFTVPAATNGSRS
jgi:K+-sensing histidine kinase KdpD